MSGLVRTPLAHQVYRELRDKIISGQLPSGSRLLPEGLAESMSISQTPVKEALVRLEADGLVEAPTRRGATVRRFTAKDLDQLYEARILIELHALRASFDAARITPAVIADLNAIQADHKVQVGKRTLDGLANALALDRAFHGTIVRLCGNDFIADWHNKIMQQTHTIMVYSFDHYPAEPTASEHSEITVALAGDDRQAALSSLRQHLVRSRKDMMAHFFKEEADISED